MDIEELSKTQLLLLTILVSFVTSIATGVLTVSLLDQAPTTVTQTVNRIVDHTIETVTTQVPSIVGNPEPDGPTTEELLVNSVAATSARKVTIYRDSSKRDLLGTGVYLPAQRAVVTTATGMPTRPVIVFANGESIAAFRKGEDGSLWAFTFAAETVLPEAPAGRLVPSADLKQGQTVIALTAEGSATTGIISKIDGTTITTDIPQAPVGAGVVNLAGDIVGVSLGGGTLIGSDRIAALIAS